MTAATEPDASEALVERLAEIRHEVVGSGGSWYCTDCNAYTEAEGRCPWNDALTAALPIIADLIAETRARLRDIQYARSWGEDW